MNVTNQLTLTELNYLSHFTEEDWSQDLIINETFLGRDVDEQIINNYLGKKNFLVMVS